MQDKAHFCVLGFELREENPNQRHIIVQMHTHVLVRWCCFTTNILSQCNLVQSALVENFAPRVVFLQVIRMYFEKTWAVGLHPGYVCKFSWKSCLIIGLLIFKKTQCLTASDWRPEKTCLEGSQETSVPSSFIQHPEACKLDGGGGGSRVSLLSLVYVCSSYISYALSMLTVWGVI